ncbi:MAG: MFS transporter [Pseudomonadota bacterium]
MLGTLASLFSPLFSGFLLMIAYGLIGILLPVRMGMEEMSTDTIGLVLSMYAVGMLFGGLYSKAMINRAGHIRVFAACAALAAISILACSLYTHAILWGLMRMLMGFCNACVFAAIDSWLSGQATQETRGRILATNQISIMTAIFIGQFGLNIADPGSSTLFVMAGMMLSLSVVPMVMSRSAGPAIEDGGSMPFKKLFLSSPLGVITCVFAGILYTGGFNMLPLFASHHGIEGLKLSQFMGAAVFGALALQFPVGMLSDRMDRRTLMLGLLVICMVGGLSVPMSAEAGSLTLMMIGVALMIGISACLYPMAISQTFDTIQQKDLVSAMGGLITVYAFGSIIGPYSASVVMKTFGANSLFTFMATAQALLLLLIVYRMFVREALPIEDQESYVPMVYETGNAIELDPRSEYQEPEEMLGLEARYALSIADEQPGVAVNIAKTLAQMSPSQAARLAGSIAQVDGVNAVRLFNTMSGALPKSNLELAEAVASGSPEHAAAIIREISQRYPEQLNDYVTAVTKAAPEVGVDVVAAAAESVVLESPDDVMEIAQAYAASLSEGREDLRPIDREAEHSEEWAGEVVSQLSEMLPEQSVEFASTFAEAIPEAVPQIATAYAEYLSDAHDHGEDTNQADAASEFVTRISEVAPDQAVDAAATLVEVMPEVASEVIDSLHQADEEFQQLSSKINEKPEDWSSD